MSINVKNVVVGMLQTNCYIIEKNSNCLIVDPGDECEKIVKEINCKPIAILVTHRHFDHIGALDELENRYSIPVYDFSNLKEGIFNIEDFNFEIIYTKGHTNDSITFYFKDDEIMFTGDFLFSGSIGRTDLPTGNYMEMQESINKILTYNDIIKVYPGHGPSTTLGIEKEYNNYLK